MKALCVAKPDHDYGSNRRCTDPDALGGNCRLTPAAKPTYGESGALRELRRQEFSRKIAL